MPDGPGKRTGQVINCNATLCYSARSPAAKVEALTCLGPQGLLADVDMSFFPDLRNITFEAKISEVGSGAFDCSSSGAQNLEFLILRNNSITELSATAFKDCNNLKYLYACFFFGFGVRFDALVCFRDLESNMLKILRTAKFPSLETWYEYTFGRRWDG